MTNDQQPDAPSHTEVQRRTNALLTVLVLMGAGVLLVVLRGVILPLFVALFLSYLGMPVMRLGRRARIPVPLLVFLVIALFVVSIGGIGLVFYASGEQFEDQWPVYDDRLKAIGRDAVDFVHRLNEKFEGDDATARTPAAGPSNESQPLIPDVDVEAARAETRRRLKGLILSGGIVEFAGDLLGGLANGLLVLVFLVFILLDRGRGVMDRRIVLAFSRPGTESARPVLEEIHRDIETYLVTKTLISILTGALVAVSLAVVHMPFAVLFGLLAFTMNYIPNVGSIIASIPPLLVALVHFNGDAGQIILVGGILIAIQFTVGNFLDPLVTGKRLHLNPITVLFWLVIWGWLWGIWGMVLAVPLAVVTRVITERTESFRAVGTLMSDS